MCDVVAAVVELNSEGVGRRRMGKCSSFQKFVVLEAVHYEAWLLRY